MTYRAGILSFCFVLAAGVAQPAMAQDSRGARCWLNGPDGKVYTTSALTVNVPEADQFQAGRALAEAIGPDLTAYVDEKFQVKGTPDYVGCAVLPSLSAARAQIDGLPDNGKFVRTEWAVRTAVLKAKQPPKASVSEGYLTITEKQRSATPIRSSAKTVSKPKALPAKSVDRGSNKSKCHLEGKRYVCPARPQ